MDFTYSEAIEYGMGMVRIGKYWYLLHRLEKY
jgi:hypothetical protein